MKNLFAVALAATGFILVAGPSHASESAIQAHWRQLRQDRPGDIRAALDSRGIELFDLLIDGERVEMLWDRASATLVLFRDGEEVQDLIMDTDQQGRPVYEASWSSDERPIVTGTVDVSREGDLVITWTQEGFESVRIELGSRGGATMAKCRCGGIKGTVYKECKEDDCNAAGTGCRRDGPVGSADTGYCEWKAVDKASPPGKIGSIGHLP